MKANASSAVELCLMTAICLAPVSQVQAAAVITFASGPNFCTTAPGYVDFPFCTIPGELPLGGFAIPALFGSYTDPNFGGVVRIMTGSPYIHPYSLPSPVSPNNKYIQILHRDTFRSTMIDLATGAIAYDPVPFAGSAHVWDANNDDVYYYISGAQIVKHVLSAKTDTVVADYNGRFASINSGGSSDTSKDNWLSFWAEKEHNVCAVDLNTSKTYCADYLAPNPASRVGWNFIDYSLITKGVDSVTGKRYVFLMAAPSLGAYSVNLSTGVLDFEYRGPENLDISQGNRDGVCDPGEPCLSAPHGDVMEDSDGKQYMVTTKGNEEPCELDLVTYSISTGRLLFKGEETGGGRHRVINLANCGTNWPDFHIGCAKKSPYCVVSIYSNAQRNPADLFTPFPSDPHRNQIMVMRGNGAEVRFLATSRSVIFPSDTYFPQPRAAISNDGAWVVFDSDFGILNGERVNLMATGFGSGAPPPITPPPITPPPITPPPPVTPPPSTPATTLVASVGSLGSINSTYTDYAGMQLQIGAVSQTLAQLGFWCQAGDSTSHMVKITSNNAGHTDLFAPISVQCDGVAGFHYVNAPGGISLTANTNYFLLAKGTPFYNRTPVVPTSIAAIPRAVSVSQSTYYLESTPNITYGPLDMKVGTSVAPANPPPPPPSNPSFDPIRINVGGRGYFDTQGRHWLFDSYAIGGDSFLTVYDIGGTEDRYLYQSSREGESTYAIAVPNGTYRVNLKFSENTMAAAGERQFNVAINGVPVLSEFDIIATVGAPFKALDKSFPITVSGGIIRIAFTNGTVDVPIINAIEILGQ